MLYFDRVHHSQYALNKKGLVYIVHMGVYRYFGRGARGSGN